MKFFLIYNDFLYRDFENKTRKIRKINICELRALYFSYVSYNLVFSVQCWPGIFLVQYRGNLRIVAAAFAATDYYQQIDRSKIKIAQK